MSGITPELVEEIAPKVSKALDLSNVNTTLTHQIATLALAHQDFERFRDECSKRFPIKQAIALKEVHEKVLAKKRPVASFAEFSDKAETLEASQNVTGGLQRKEMGEVPPPPDRFSI
jgi:hypothetical protein